MQHNQHQPYQLDLFHNRPLDTPDIHEIMVDLRDSSEGLIGPYFADDLAWSREQWRQEFHVRQELRKYFYDRSAAISLSETFEEFIEAWHQLSEAYWCPDEQLKSSCDACDRPLQETECITLSSGTVVHFGGKYGAHCLSYIRLVKERERDEAIAALKRMGID